MLPWKLEQQMKHARCVGSSPHVEESSCVSPEKGDVHEASAMVARPNTAAAAGTIRLRRMAQIPLDRPRSS